MQKLLAVGIQTAAAHVLAVVVVIWFKLPVKHANIAFWFAVSVQSTPGDVVAGVHPAVAVTHPAVIADTVFPENVYVFFIIE